MKTKINFWEKSEKIFDLDVDLDVQPSSGTVFTFADVDRLPDFICGKRWYVSETEFYAIGDAVSGMDMRMIVTVKPTT